MISGMVLTRNENARCKIEILALRFGLTKNCSRFQFPEKRPIKELQRTVISGFLLKIFIWFEKKEDDSFFSSVLFLRKNF